MPVMPIRRGGRSPRAEGAEQVVELVEKCDVDRLLVWAAMEPCGVASTRCSAEGLDHVAIGVLPAGTGNLLANNLGIPIDLPRCGRCRLHGEPVRSTWAS